VGRPPGSERRPDRFRRAWPPASAAVVLIALLTLPAARAQEAGAPSAAATFYIRTDSDQTTVITPRLRVGAPVAEATRVDLVYTVDVWTSASIDIRTSASKAVTEQRDEIDVSLQQAFTDVSVSGSYRYSTEYDYESHGAGLSAAYDFADNNAQVALAARGYFDQVGRAGDPGFERASDMLTASASFTQVLDADTVVQLIYELTSQDGYLSSPYRFVRIADDVGAIPSTCAYPTTAYVPRTLRGCMPENNPGTRLRHAAAVHGRRALGTPLSVGAGYRFYIDDWDMTSHTASADVALTLDPGWLLSLGYRFYLQSSASHFAPFYRPMELPGHYTSDKELSAMTSHRIELELGRTFALDDLGSELNTVLRAAPSYFAYDEYRLLDHVTALELTLTVGVTL